MIAIFNVRELPGIARKLDEAVWIVITLHYHVRESSIGIYLRSRAHSSQFHNERCIVFRTLSK